MAFSLKTSALLLGLLAGSTANAQSVPCGGDWGSFIANLGAEAAQRGINQNAINATLSGARLDQSVLNRDRAQGVFKQTFLEFSQRSVSGYRMNNGAANMQKFASVFQRAYDQFGVPPEVITAFWALETDFGAVQGDFNTVNALVTLAYDCRRPHLFRPQIFAAMELVAHGDLDPRNTTGAWAGEIGMVQMLPHDILTKGIDGDGDGHVTLKTSAPDAIMTAANMISSLGWRPREPWLIEVSVPQNIPWQQSGLHTRLPVQQWTQMGITARNGNMPSSGQASLLAPQGRLGPTFLAFPNYDVYLEWNQSFIYSTTAAYFATRLGGAQRYNAGNPEPGLSDSQMRRLQEILQSRGYDVGAIDGILGSRTRDAVQAEQQRLGMPADAWPTQALLNRY